MDIDESCIALPPPTRTFTRVLSEVAFDPAGLQRRPDAGELLHVPIGGGNMRDASFYGETIIPKPYAEMRRVGRGSPSSLYDEALLPQSIIVFVGAAEEAAELPTTALRCVVSHARPAAGSLP